MTIKTQFDLRLEHCGARDQGNRPTCLAFALSDLNGHANKQPTALSPEFLYREAAAKVTGWKPGDGLPLLAGLSVTATPGQPSEIACPYQPDEPTLPLAPNVAYTPMFRGTYVYVAPTITNITTALSSGRSVGLVLKLTSEFFDVDPVTGQIIFTTGVLVGQNHAVVAVGHGIDLDTNETHILIRNSWGADWGLRGHAWIPAQYVMAHAICAFGV